MIRKCIAFPCLMALVLVGFAMTVFCGDDLRGTNE